VPAASSSSASLDSQLSPPTVGSSQHSTVSAPISSERDSGAQRRRRAVRGGGRGGGHGECGRGVGWSENEGNDAVGCVDGVCGGEEEMVLVMDVWAQACDAYWVPLSKVLALTLSLHLSLNSLHASDATRS
jgi:hypothetical protein